ncbi:type II secretion system F family protein [Candidatus Sumerlaeota bacterium]|nr:type II secretion system F family protein [Candidatus Sumerlaeota bacterium]
MPSFQYAARSPQGRMVSGVIEAGNAGLVARQLRDKGLIPTSITAGREGVVHRRPKGRTGRVRLDDLVVFSRQFSTMIRAGLPLIEVLNILSEQAEKVNLKKILKQVENDVEAGASLTEALLKHPKVFGTFFISMVKAGEAAGMLASILDQIAQYLEKLASLQRKIKSAVVYPIVLSVVAFALLTFLMTVVVPVFIDIFSQLDQKLPVPTRVTIFVYRIITVYWLHTAIGIGVTVAAFVSWYRTKSGRMILDKLQLRMPVFGPLFLKVGIAKFTRTLSTLIKSGVNILSALEIVAATSGNAVIEDAIVKTRVSIQSGESISRPLAESQVFPPMVTRMIDVGERVGSLESMLSKIADFYEDQVDAAVAGLTSLLEPVMIVLLGIVIGFIVISMFLPLFSMVNAIK